MKYRITTWLAAALMLSSLHATAASLSDIQVSNGDQQARITLSFVGEPEYSFTPQGKRLVALDIKQTGVLQGLPLQFSGSNLVKSIRAGDNDFIIRRHRAGRRASHGLIVGHRRLRGGHHRLPFMTRRAERVTP